MPAIDIWGTARKMRELYGAFAAPTAMQRARKAWRDGDPVRARRWTDIAQAVGGWLGETQSLAAGMPASP